MLNKSSFLNTLAAICAVGSTVLVFRGTMMEDGDIKSHVSVICGAIYFVAYSVFFSASFITQTIEEKK